MSPQKNLAQYRINLCAAGGEDRPTPQFSRANPRDSWLPGSNASIGSRL